MKKSVIFILLFLVLVSFASAEPVFITKQTKFQPGETLIGQIKIESGEFNSQISYSNIKFFDGRRETFFDFDLIPYNDSYYFYAYLNKQGNFTLKVSDILYSDEEGVLKSFTLNKELLVYPTEINHTKILSIRPGVIFTSTQPEVIFENKGNTAFNLTYKVSGAKGNPEKISLYPNRPEKIKFQANFSFFIIDISSYSDFDLPIIYTGRITSPNIENNQTTLKADKKIIQIKTKVNNLFPYSFTLFNFENNISKMKIKKISDIITIGSYNPEILAGGEQTINLSFLSKNQGSFIDNLTISFLEKNIAGEIIIPVEIYVFSENTSLENISINGSLGNTNSLTCAQKGFNLCQQNMICNGDDAFARDGYCCKIPCSPTNNSNNSGGFSFGWLIGLVIFLGIGAGGYFLYKKVKSTKPQPASEVIDSKTKSFESRVFGGVSRT